MAAAMDSCCFALVGDEPLFHPTMLLPGRADPDSSGSSRQSTPRVSGVAIFNRRDANGAIGRWQVPANMILT